PGSLAVAADPRAEYPERDRAPDAQTAVPDLERVDRVLALAEVLLVVGDDVVQPPADDAEHDGPARDVPDVVALAAPGPPPARREGQRDEDADDDAQRVGTDGKRSEMPHRPGRAGNRSHVPHPATVVVGVPHPALG